MIGRLLARLIGGRQYLSGAGARLYAEGAVRNMTGRREAVRIGDRSHVKGELLTFAHGGEIRIGSDCYVGEHSKIWSARSIIIGDRVLISHAVTILDNMTHPLEAGARHRHFRTIVEAGHPKDIDLGERPVEVEDDVWIGCQSVILRGVRIGRGAIVGAGSVVTKDVAPGVIVAGNPAKFIRELEPEGG